MIFLQPLLLLALLTLPVILILHLLRERRRRVSVPSLLHWRNLPRRPDGERIRRLPLTLILLLQLLIAGLIGLALGRPQITGALGGASRQAIIVIDASTSMAAREGSTTRFAQAQDRARAILRGLGAGDRATLIVAGRSARVVADGAGDALPGVVAALDGLRPGGSGADIDGALTLAEAALDPRRAAQITVISDGALPQIAPRALAAALDWRQVGAAQPNRAIIAFATRRWGGKLQAYARAANYDAAPFRATLRLYGDDQLLDTRDVQIGPEGETELTWTLTDAHATLRAEIDGRDGLPQDDQAFLAVAAARPIAAVLVSAHPDPLRRALAASPGVSVTVVDPSGYPAATPRAADLTVFDGFLPQAWPPGAVLAVNPPPGSPALIDVEGLPRLAPGGELEQSGELMDGLNLGGVNFGRIQQVTSPPWAETQLALGDQPLILRGRSGSNEIAIWTFDLATGDLPTRLAFPLLAARTVRDLAPAPLPQAIQAGEPLSLRPDARADAIVLSGPDGATQRRASGALVALDALDRPGFYRVEERAGADTLFAGQVGVSAGAAIESDLRPRPAPQLTGASHAGAGDAGQPLLDLWPWLALGALALLMLEWGYIHR